MILATMETSHFTFHALGLSKDQCMTMLITTWQEKHCRDYPAADPHYVVDNEDSINYVEIELGTVCRDNEPIDRF